MFMAILFAYNWQNSISLFNPAGILITLPFDKWNFFFSTEITYLLPCLVSRWVILRCCLCSCSKLMICERISFMVVSFCFHISCFVPSTVQFSHWLSHSAEVKRNLVLTIKNPPQINELSVPLEIPNVCYVSLCGQDCDSAFPQL